MRGLTRRLSRLQARQGLATGLGTWHRRSHRRLGGLSRRTRLTGRAARLRCSGDGRGRDRRSRLARASAKARCIEQLLRIALHHHGRGLHRRAGARPQIDQLRRTRLDGARRRRDRRQERALTAAQRHGGRTTGSARRHIGRRRADDWRTALAIGDDAASDNADGERRGDRHIRRDRSPGGTILFIDDRRRWCCDIGRRIDPCGRRHDGRFGEEIFRTGTPHRRRRRRPPGRRRCHEDGRRRRWCCDVIDRRAPALEEHGFGRRRRRHVIGDFSEARRRFQRGRQAAQAAARFQRMRPARITTQIAPIAVRRIDDQRAAPDESFAPRRQHAAHIARIRA